MVIKRKTRKQGNSVMINIPSEFKVEEGKEYTLVQKKMEPSRSFHKLRIILRMHVLVSFMNPWNGRMLNHLEGSWICDLCA